MPPLEIIHIPPNSPLRRKPQAGSILNDQNRKSFPFGHCESEFDGKPLTNTHNSLFSASSMRMAATEPINLTLQSQESSYETSNSPSNFVCFLFRKKRRVHNAEWASLVVIGPLCPF
ncbi:hypothetical protein ACJW30_04G023800 [Castanea mollissima]